MRTRVKERAGERKREGDREREKKLPQTAFAGTGQAAAQLLFFFVRLPARGVVGAGQELGGEGAHRVNLRVEALHRRQTRGR